MPWSFLAPIAGAAVSSIFGPDSTAGGAGSNTYTPTGLASSDQQWQNLQNQNVNLINQGNQYSGGYQNAANQAGQQYGNLSGIANANAGIYGQQAQQNYGAQNYLQNAGQQVYGMAMDPQQQLFNRTQGQLDQQVNAGQAQRGLGTSAEGGAEYNQAMSNFDIDWQNQQLGRAESGLGSLNAAYAQGNQSGALGNTDMNNQLASGQAGAGYQLQAGQTPYGAANTMQNNTLGQNAGVQGLANTYMNYGQGAAQQNYTNAAQAAGGAGALVNQGIGALGKSNTDWSSMFGPGTIGSSI